ncbi:MAG: hypothetical protein QM764_21410 [Chitinophagaceae bacterium]
MDSIDKNLHIFELHHEIVKLQQDYQVATEKDLQFSVKKKIRLQIKAIMRQLASLEDKEDLKDITGKENFNCLNDKS